MVRPSAVRTRIASLCFACSFAGGASAQLTAAPGFESTSIWFDRGSPFGFRGFVVAADGEVWRGVDNNVWRRDANGRDILVRAFAFGSSLSVITATRTAVLYGDFAQSTLWSHDLGTRQETSRPMPKNTYDLVVRRDSVLLASANPNWPQPGNRTGIWIIDPGGAHREIIALSGPSGPIAIDPRNRDLWYATQSSTFPTPPGAVSVIRFDAGLVDAAVRGGRTLTTNDAATVVAGLDGGTGLAFDDRNALYISDSQHGDVRRIDPAGSLDSQPLVQRSPQTTLGVQFVEAGPGTFDGWQPADGGTLYVGSSDWQTASGIHAVRPERATIRSIPQSPIPPAPFRIEARALPPNASGWVLLNNLRPLPAEQLIARAGGVPIWSAMDFTLLPIVGTTTTDAVGTTFLNVPYAGGLSWDLSFQIIAATTQGTLATTPVLSIRLQP